MSFAIGTANFNANNSTTGGSADLQSLITQWQVQTCAGVNVGTPLLALQVVAINKLQAAICNPETIIGNYNIAGRVVLTDGQTLNIAAGSVHSVAFKQVAGNGTVALAGGLAQAVIAGEYDSWTASTLLNTAFVFECVTGKMVITTQEPEPIP